MTFLNNASAQSLILSFPIVTCFGSAHTNLRVHLSPHHFCSPPSQQQHGPASDKTCNALRRIHLGSSSTAALHRRLLVHLALGMFLRGEVLMRRQSIHAHGRKLRCHILTSEFKTALHRSEDLPFEPNLQAVGLQTRNLKNNRLSIHGDGISQNLIQ